MSNCPTARPSPETGIHLQATAIRSRAIAADRRETGIDLRAHAADSREIGIYIKEIAIDRPEIATYIREIDADIQEMATDIGKISINSPRHAARSREMATTSRVSDDNHQEINDLRMFPGSALISME